MGAHPWSPRASATPRVSPISPCTLGMSAIQVRANVTSATFKELDSNLGERVLAETGLNPASLVQDERKEDTSEGEKAFQQFRKEVAAFEATNRDYIIDLTNWRLVELEEN